MIEINNQSRSQINLKLVQKISEKFLKHFHHSSYDVSIAFVGDRKIRKLNKVYRGIDRVTDVLAFPGEGKFLGEIILNYAQIKRQAKRFDNTPKQELIFILIHGLLHLLGYEDKTKKGKDEMLKLGREVINKII